MTSEEEEVYKEVKRALIRDYYSGRLTEEEYESKLTELERRRYGETTGGGGGGFSLFPRDSIWTDLDLPPEKFDLYAPISVMAMGVFFFIFAYFVYIYQDVFLQSGGQTGFGLVLGSMILMGILCIITPIPWLTTWRKKKREGLYELRQERYWHHHDDDD